MKKYIVINVIEREIYLLGVFDTLEQARNKMKEDFVKELDDAEMLYDINKEEYQEFLSDSSKTDWFGDGFEFDNKTAYINGNNYNYDWKIFEREI